MRIIFMGTPGFAQKSLASLIDHNEKVAAVFTQPDKPRGRGKNVSFSPVKELALKHRIPVLQPVSLRNELVYRQVKDLAPDLIIVVAYGQLLPKQVLDLPSAGCINVHASLLPKYRGAAPIHWAVINGEDMTGVTTMFMSRELDAGDIILKEPVPIGPTTTGGELHDRLAGIGSKLLLKTIALIKQGKCPRTPQDESEATYAPVLLDFHEVIHWEKSAGAIVNHVRGMNPWPGAYTVRKGERLKIFLAQIGEGFAEQGLVGQVVAFTERGFIVRAGSGAVEVTKVQPAGKKQMDGADFLRGYHLKKGEILG